MENDSEDQYKFDMLVKNVDIYLYLFNVIVTKHDYDENDKYSILKLTNDSLHFVSRELFELYLKPGYDEYMDRLTVIEMFSKQIMSIDDTNTLVKKLNIIVKFVKKIKNYSVDIELFNKKFASDNFNEKYKKYKTLKFINWCFST